MSRAEGSDIYNLSVWRTTYARRIEDQSYINNGCMLMQGVAPDRISDLRVFAPRARQKEVNRGNLRTHDYGGSRPIST